MLDARACSKRTVFDLPLSSGSVHHLALAWCNQRIGYDIAPLVFLSQLEASFATPRSVHGRQD